MWNRRQVRISQELYKFIHAGPVHSTCDDVALVHYTSISQCYQYQQSQIYDTDLLKDAVHVIYGFLHELDEVR